MLVKDAYIISEKQYSETKKSEDKFTEDLKDFFGKVCSLVLYKVDENNDNVLLYEIEEIMNSYKDEYMEILSDNIQDIFINTSHTVEATVNNQVASKSIENYMILQASKDFDYQSLLDEWLNDKQKIEQTIQKKLKYNNNTQTTLNRYLNMNQAFRLTAEELFEYEIDQAIIKYMTENVFVASESTLSRVTQDIYNIIKESYGEEGNGVLQVRNDIIERFDELTKYEAERIARTETLKAQGQATYNRLVNNPDVEYIQWLATDDDRTRDSHAEIDGEITYANGNGIFSNGLRFPGDTSGDIEEWINCRCTLVAYIPDVGFTAPLGVDNWYEEDMLFNTDVWNIDIPEIEVGELTWI